MGRQHRLRWETTTRPKRARRDDSEQVRSDRSSQFTWPVRQITAHLRSHQQGVGGGVGQMAKAVSQLVFEVEEGEQVLEEDEAGEGGEGLGVELEDERA